MNVTLKLCTDNQTCILILPFNNAIIFECPHSATQLDQLNWILFTFEIKPLSLAFHVNNLQICYITQLLLYNITYYTSNCITL